MTYEITHLTYDEHENNIPKNRKIIILRMKEEHSSESSSDDDLELLTIKFKKFIKQELKNKTEFYPETTTCYGCKKPGHSKDKCTKKKKKALKDESSASGDEDANYALVAFENEVSNLTKTPLLYYEIT
ncbi:unnamed protein product [Musa textilis]